MNSTELTPIDALVGYLPPASTVVWLLFFVILLYTAIHAGVFVYHWHTYNIAPGRFLTLTYTVYFAGILVFLGLLFLSALALIT